MSNETVTVDKGVLVRAAAAISAYLSAMRVDDPQDNRETIMARIRGADAMALPAYEELYWLLHPEEAARTRGVLASEPKLICPECGIDRYTHGCQRANCAFVAVATATPVIPATPANTPEDKK
jgi:hypothetical protein